MDKRHNGQIKIGLAMMLLLVCMILLPKPVRAAGSMSLNQKNKTLVVGDTYQLKISGTAKKVRWYSSNTRVVKVNKKGLITAKRKGTAVVKARVAGKTYRCKVTVVYQHSANVTNTVKKINKQRRKYGRASLKKNEYLMKAAKKRAKEISVKFSATKRPKGSYWTSAIDMKYNFNSTEEIIGRECADVTSVIKMWMGRSDTQSAILNSYYKEIGVGYYVDDFGKSYWVVIFANRQ